MEALACARCGSPNPPGARFCSQCASPLAPPAATPPSVEATPGAAPPPRVVTVPSWLTQDWVVPIALATAAALV